MFIELIYAVMLSEIVASCWHVYWSYERFITRTFLYTFLAM